MNVGCSTHGSAPSLIIGFVKVVELAELLGGE